MPRSSAAHASEMRERILDGAHRAMLAGGYRGTTMPAIAAEADVSVGLLYRYFESKEELYLAMCESVTQAQLDELAVQISQITDARERLARAVGYFVESLDTEHWGAIVTTGWAEADIKPALRDMLRRRCDQIRAFAAMFLREADRARRDRAGRGGRGAEPRHHHAHGWRHRTPGGDGRSVRSRPCAALRHRARRPHAAALSRRAIIRRMSSAPRHP